MESHFFGQSICEFAREHNIKFNDSDIKVKVANDHVIDVVGQTKELHIEIKSHTCDLSMFVLPNSNFQVLLGLNWFMESGCSVNPAKRTLQFKSEFFSLDGTDVEISEEEEATFFAVGQARSFFVELTVLTKNVETKFYQIMSNDQTQNLLHIFKTKLAW